MTAAKKSLGDKGEKIALEFLREHKYKILAKNFHTRFGELDIVARDGDTLVFVEVKTRSSRDFGTPAEAITSTKLRNIEKAGQIFRAKHEGLPDAERVDVVSIEVDSSGAVTKKELIANAFL